MKTRDQSELVNIGRISAAVGLRGELRVYLYATDSDNLKEGKVLLLKLGRKQTVKSGSPEPAKPQHDFEAKCVAVRYQGTKGAGGIPVIKLEGINDRNAAEALKGYEVYLEAENLEPLPEGQHYVRDLIGYSVYDRASGQVIGTLRDVIQNTAQSVLDIEGVPAEGSEHGKQIMVPAVDAFLKLIDDERRTIELDLIPGFLD